MGKNMVERFDKNAFTDCLATKPEIVCQIDHDKRARLGSTPDRLKVWADDVGLKYECTPVETSHYRDFISYLEAGEIRGSSFNFLPVEVEWKVEKGMDVRYIRKALVREVSPVFEPAYGNSSCNLRSLPDSELRALEQERDDFLAKMETEKRLQKLQSL